MAINDYNDPIVIKWETDEYGNKQSILKTNEEHVVVKNKFTLKGIPDLFYKVQIVGFTEIKLNQVITTNTQFKVDYTIGEIIFHPDKEAETITVSSYYSRGILYYPSSRIYTELDNAGNVKETLADIFDKSKVVYKIPVATFANITTTYPNPEAGWVVQVEDTGRFYRWDGSAWQYFQILHPTQLAQLLTDVGDKAFLTTINKSNLVGAVSEVKDEIVEHKINYTQFKSEIVTFHANKFITKIKNGDIPTVVFLGDSTTEQNSTTGGQPNHVGQLKTWLEGIYGVGTFTVINAGVSGDNIIRMWERVYSDVILQKPDLVIICSGLNDQGGTETAITVENFRKNYNLIIREILASCETDIILRSPNITQTPATNTALIPYVEVARDVAMKYQLGFFDLFTKMKSDSDSDEITLSTLMNDNVHPNAAGHTYICNNFKPFFEQTDYIIVADDSYKMCSVKGGFRVNETGAELVLNNGRMNGAVLAFDSPSKFVEFDFIGDEFSIIYVGASSTGQFVVYIDGVAQTLVDTYRAITAARGFVTYSGLSNTKHTIKIEGQSTKNPSSSSTNLQIQGALFHSMNSKTGQFLDDEFIDLRLSGTFNPTSNVETTVPFATATISGGVASLNVATGEVTILKSGFYQILFANRVTTTQDSLIEANYKINDAVQKRAYVRTTTTAGTHEISVEFVELGRLIAGQVIKFAIKSGGITPSDFAYAVLVKLN